ncbi:protein sel-1 homolog 1 [Eupeodes corollae]|uniref:protein sel-1 homolog 1 n=1 Tax=Eupeodes corollae TaxID=290404 RepID=UPI0024905692|nr:protein sel-1 homolog 1 [Eupeodes corollae]
MKIRNKLLLFGLIVGTLAISKAAEELKGPPEPNTSKVSEENKNEPPEGSPTATDKPTATATPSSTDDDNSGSDDSADSSKTIFMSGLHLPLLISARNQQQYKLQLEKEIQSVEAAINKPEPKELTDEEQKAEIIYQEATELLNKRQGDKVLGQLKLEVASKMNHIKARCDIAWAHVLGIRPTDFEFAAKEFEELSKLGLPEANMGMAFLYSVGVGGKNISQPLALMHYTLAALGGDIHAQMALGYRYSFGINVPLSCEKSLSFYKRVAKIVASKITFSSGPIVHRVRLLDELENSGSQETELVDYYQLLADKGDVQSQVGLGQLYYQGGKATEQDLQKALEYFTQAANAGNAIGFAFLGKLYLEGSEHIKADHEAAFKFFKKAAELGDPIGQSGLGLMYLQGLGVPKDTTKAFNYFTQASDQGWVDGQLQLGNMYFNGNGVKTDYKLALKYFSSASQSGHVLAYYNLGVMHAYGLGMLRSCPAAVEFFKNVAERGRWSEMLMQAYNDYKKYEMDTAYMKYALLAEMGYEVGQSNAAFLLDRNEVTIFNDRHEDLIRGFYYWKRAAAQGYSAAQVKLGDYYYYGWGTAVDFESSASLYRKAAEQHFNAQAMFNLGYMHEQGLGMKKDLHLAKRLYDLAAETSADAKVPVALALMKLQFIAQLEALRDSPYKFIFYMDENIAANWDLYMITVLTLLLGFIMYTRRPYQNQPPPANNEDEQGAAQANNDVPTAAATPAAENSEAGANEKPTTSQPPQAEPSTSGTSTSSAVGKGAIRKRPTATIPPSTSAAPSTSSTSTSPAAANASSPSSSSSSIPLTSRTSST